MKKATRGRRADPASADRATGNRAARSDGAARRGCSGEGNGARRVRVLRALQISRIPGRGRTTPRGWNHRCELVCRGNFGSRRYSGSIPQRETVPVGAEFFEALGFRLEQIRGASAWRAFRFRFPWLLVTVTGGTVSAILAGFFEATLAGSLIIAFFLTMVLGLTESVSMQTMSVTIHALRSVSVTRDWLASAFRRELATAALLGVSCGFVVCVIAWAWRHDCARQLLSAEALRSRW
jgi:Mg/Co/Ni transporter MgtE (contains CBS domain)